MKTTLLLLIGAASAHHHQVPVSLGQKYWDKGDANMDTADKYAAKFSDVVNGIVRPSEVSQEEAEKQREAAIEQSNARLMKGRYKVIADDTGDRFLDYPEGRGFPPGYERNLANWARS